MTHGFKSSQIPYNFCLNQFQVLSGDFFGFFYIKIIKINAIRNYLRFLIVNYQDNDSVMLVESLLNLQ